jgi:hypothetical protein
VEQRIGGHDNSSVVLFQANSGSPVMRFSNATHVCLLNSMGICDEDNDDDAEFGFAVVRLIETDVRSNALDRCSDYDELFSDMSEKTSTCLLPEISISALLVMHDLAVAASLSAASPGTTSPSSVLPIPRVLPPDSWKYVFSHNFRMRRGRQASLRSLIRQRRSSSSNFPHLLCIPVL